MSTLPHAADNEHAARPPQFGLRAMFIGMAVVSAVFGLFNALGPAWSTMLVLFASLIGLHVIGNAIGTKLRDDRHNASSAKDDNSTIPLTTTSVPTFIAARRLQENTTIRRPWLIVALLFAAIGGVAGGFAISAAVGSKITPAGLSLGIFSSAVLGGFAGFMASSLWSIVRSAWREAIREPSEDVSPR